MTYLERMTLQTLSFRAYGRQNHYIKVMRDGILTMMEESLDDGNNRVYRGLKYPNLTEITSIMEKVIADKIEAERIAKEQLDLEQQPFKDIPAPKLKPFSASLQELEDSISAEVTANQAGNSDEVQKRT